MTDRVYLRDAYQNMGMAKVVRTAGENRVVLDKTIFYAESGGQAPDHGTLSWPGGSTSVVDAQNDPENPDDVVHVLEGTTPPVGTEVYMELDWPRRYGLMRYHSAAHVIAAVLHRMNATFTGGQLYPDRARIDVEFPEWKPEMRDEITAAVNAEIQKDYAIRNYFISREEFEKRDDLIRTKENLVDPRFKEVRITDIVGPDASADPSSRPGYPGRLDAQADGGTHVKRTNEIGLFVIDKVDNKGKGHRRISFRCEDPVTNAKQVGAA